MDEVVQRSEVQGRITGFTDNGPGLSVVHRAKDHKSSGHQNKAVIIIIIPPPELLEEITWKGDSA